jgi:hypothetical protein
VKAKPNINVRQDSLFTEEIDTNEMEIDQVEFSLQELRHESINEKFSKSIDEDDE